MSVFPKHQSGSDIRWSFALDQRTAWRAEQAARACGLSKSAWVRALMTEAIEKHERAMKGKPINGHNLD